MKHYPSTGHDIDCKHNNIFTHTPFSNGNANLLLTQFVGIITALTCIIRKLLKLPNLY